MANRGSSDEPVGFVDSPDGFGCAAFVLLFIAVAIFFLVFGGNAQQQPIEDDPGAAEKISA